MLLLATAFNLSTLIYCVFVIAIAGVIVWAIQTLVPMPPWAKTLITVLCIIFALLFLMDLFTGGSFLGGSPNARLR